MEEKVFGNWLLMVKWENKFISSMRKLDFVGNLISKTIKKLHKVGKLKFKKGVHVETDDFYYDLFLGGYIKPEELLEDAGEVAAIKSAIEVIERFKNELEVQGIMEDY